MNDAECWICGRTIAEDEPRRQVSLVGSDPWGPPLITGIACMGCYRGTGQSYEPGTVTTHVTSRILNVRAHELLS